MLVIGHTPHLRRKAFIIYSFLLLPSSVYGILVGDNLRKPLQDRVSRKIAHAGVVTFVSRQGCWCMHMYGVSVWLE